MNNAVGVRFQKLGKLYHFDAGGDGAVQPGDHVIVETKRGKQLGQVISYIEPDKIFSISGACGQSSVRRPRASW
jgi:cell fate regulator YaaT (PSP1 superfamily)